MIGLDNWQTLTTTMTPKKIANDFAALASRGISHVPRSYEQVKYRQSYQKIQLNYQGSLD
ncbi:hypothetical protein C6Y11_07855 [Lactiplantibacillus pentosus]|nr:hypothetical protein [Lactiplantibacillus pentosus]MCT3302008.1 hypothetical protein [Lactiplantibacillus pentosus]PRO80182.1 hypothetical protein C6Y11_07855 [Lactiplantibacillus pentosus]PRO82945.1 hypothetical protein C6Y09_03425 [Lactiplantibacillus pentosus]PRO93866.1 hypothetical protein C6Y12_00780 [Lactiplantibacillus pentosus]